MRVIAGQARGRRLLPVPGAGTRPITDRAKEALFGILGPRVQGAGVLDLFAGTGSVGIEALSRGAAACDFVEWDPAALRTIRSNLDRTGLTTGGRVIRADVFDFLRRAPPRSYDLVYVAPPQYHGLWHRALAGVDAEPGWLKDSAMVVAQIHPREFEAVHLTRLTLVDSRRYGSVQLLFFALDLTGDAQGRRNLGPPPS